MPRTRPVPPPPSLLATRREAAALGRVSLSTWDRFVREGLTPAPIRVSGSVRFRRTDLERWIELGCPSRVMFEAQAAAGKAVPGA